MGMQRHRTRLPIAILRTELKGWSPLPTLEPTHYLRYLEIQTSDDLCITSYCDNSTLLTNEKAFHTRDIDSSSWYTRYTKPGHDVIMTLSALRTNLPLRLLASHYFVPRYIIQVGQTPGSF
jgi:hypothetical protein